MANAGAVRRGQGIARRMLAWVLVMVVVGLGGCAYGGRPPMGDTTAALAQQLAQTQTLLSPHLPGIQPAADYTVGNLSVTRRQTVQGGERPIVLVEGTYTLGGRALSRQQRRQTRPFRLYLQRLPEGEWTLVPPPAPTEPA